MPVVPTETPMPLQILRGLLDRPDFQHLNGPDFFGPELSLLHSPMALPDLELAVTYLQQAIEARQRILLVGDRDVDGVSSCALLANFLDEVHVRAGGLLEVNVSDDGDDYGLSGEFFQKILNDPADLIILLDMGSSHGPEIERLTAVGAKVVILDHHQLHSRVPDQAGVAFVNPRRRETELENAGQIATVGLAFKYVLGYALAHTKDWNAAYFLQRPGSEEGGLFRYGAFLGRYPDASAAAAEWGDRLEIRTDLPGGVEAFADQDWARIESEPVLAGRLVFFRHIMARPKLREFIRKWTDLVAVGLITDLVPLTGENRALVRLGLGLADGAGDQRPRSFAPGLRALLDSLRLPISELRSRDVGFSIGPALNAAGRMGRTRLALEVLTARDARTARPLVEALLDLNRQRKDRTATNESLAREHFDRYPEKTREPLIFCFRPDFFPGVSGIIATRLTELYEKPAAFLHLEGTHVKGSIRTYGGRNMLELLERAEDLFKQYGGHPQAAGFSLDADRVEELERRLVQAAREIEAAGANPGEAGQAEYHIELPPARLDHATLRELALLEPFGPGNPEPVLRLSRVRLYDLRELSGGRHVKFRVAGTPAGVEAVFWGGGPELLAKTADSEEFDLYGSLEMSFFRGQRTVQLRVARVEPCGP